MIYFSYIILLLFLLYIEKLNNFTSKACRIIIPILFTLLIGLRGKFVGVDTNVYFEHYYTFGRWGCEFVEIGFDWLNRVLYSFKFGAEAFFIAHAAITNLFIYLALKNYKKEYTIAAFCLYLLTFTFLVNGMRQGVACAIFLYAYKFIEQKKFLPYALLISFASLFHASALMLILLYIVGRIRFSANIYILIYALSFLVIFIDISPYIPNIVIMGRDYGNHLENIKIKSASLLGYIVSTSLNIIIFMLLIKNNLHKNKTGLFNLILLSFILKNFAFNIPILNRVTIYFAWFEYLSYPYIFSLESSPLFKNVYATRILVIAITSAIWLNAIFSRSNMLMPYKFYWEETNIYTNQD